MTRLIDANALKYDFGEINDGKKKWWDLYVTNEAIAQQPTVDAVPVKHGKWREYPIADGMNQCSECGVLRFGESNYCPNCGCRMDAERKEE